MTHELHTLIAVLLPPTDTVRLTKVTVEQTAIRLQLTAMAPTATCPRCAVPSSAIHSRYQRHPTDLPWGTCAVRIQLMVRKFVCRHQACTRRIFTERVPDLVAPYARKTHRLITVLRAIGAALGGNAGARLAARLRLPTSPATVLCLVRTAPVLSPPSLQAVGVNEWAWRRGERRGDHLEAWMAEAIHSDIDALARFARRLQHDLPAIKAGLTLEWSNGATEGQIHRLKLVKRQGDGRVGFALLRQRVLHVA